MTTSRFFLGLALAAPLLAGWLQAAPDSSAPSLEGGYLAVLRSGDLGQLRKGFEGGWSAQARDEFGNTPLMHATVYGSLETMRFLIDRGADVNAANQFGATVLMRAAFDSDRVELVLAHGAKVNARSALGNTALILAARTSNSHRAVDALLKHGAEVNATNNWGASALMAAAAGGDARSVSLLLERGANAKAQPQADPEGFLLGGARDALSWAAFRGDLEIMKLLLDAGADVNARGMFGTPLVQAAWAERTAASQLLLERGAKVDLAGPYDEYAPLHWAASTDESDPSLVNLLLRHGANPNLGGGENVDAFLGTPQSPLMLAQRRGETAIVAALRAGGATEATPDRVPRVTPGSRELPATLDASTVLAAINRALGPLQKTSLGSKEAFVRHSSRQDCISCHQQNLPMAALGWAKKQRAAIDRSSEERLIEMVRAGDLKLPEADWQALFHPEPAHGKGYAVFGWAAEDLPADSNIDSWVHHLAAIQGPEGQWFNNLPRPPLQTGDITATALAIHALQRYPLPGRNAEFAERIARGGRWLRQARSETTESRAYQLLGVAWAGAPASELEDLAKSLLDDQRADGGWAQLAGLKTDAYATGQTVFALRTAAGLSATHPAVDRGLRFLLSQQLDDGTWHVRRRAFPFQPTMNSGFPHGRDSWISAAASSWAVMALSAGPMGEKVALQR